MNLKRQLEMQRRYAAQARGEKPAESVRIEADFIGIPGKPKRPSGKGGYPSAPHPNETVVERTKRKPRNKPEGGE